MNLLFDSSRDINIKTKKKATYLSCFFSMVAGTRLELATFGL